MFVGEVGAVGGHGGRPLAVGLIFLRTKKDGKSLIRKQMNALQMGYFLKKRYLESEEEAGNVTTERSNVESYTGAVVVVACSYRPD